MFRAGKICRFVAIVINVFILIWLISLLVTTLLSNEACPDAQAAPKTAVLEISGQVILQLGYQRSGSTFLGNVIQESEGTMTFFEPLNTLIGEPNEYTNEDMGKISNLLTKFMDCSFPHLPGYTYWLKETPYFFNKMKYLRSKCLQNRPSCYNATFIEKTCQKAKRRHIKSFFVPIRRLDDFLNTLDRRSQSKITVVYLVRDPRAILNSRKQRRWCKGDCRSIRSICHEMKMDLQAYDKLKAKMNKRFIMLRYEDMALRPEKVTEQLFKLLGLKFTKKIRKFVRDHTQLNVTDKRNTQDYIYRSSKTRINRWVKQLTGKEVREAQSSCQQVMKNLGYFSVPSERIQEKVIMNDDHLYFIPVKGDFRKFHGSDRFHWKQ